MAHVMRSHELFTHSIYETAELSGRKKRKRLTVEEPAEEHPQVTVLRRALEGVRLKCWPYVLPQSHGIRTHLRSDSRCTPRSSYGLRSSPITIHSRARCVPRSLLTYATSHGPI